MKRDFEKWHGCENDFIIFDLPNDPFLKKAIIDKAQSLCRRDALGIGADGILILERFGPDANDSPRLTIINSDGSEAANCGNGIRCAAAFLNQSGERDSLLLTLKDNYQVLCRYSQSNKKWVSVSMGIPTQKAQAEISNRFDAVFKEIKKSYPGIDCDDSTAWSLMNDHLLLKVDSELSIQTIVHIGQMFQDQQGINVHFIREKQKHAPDQEKALNQVGRQLGEVFEVWPFERGAGLTKACGSGACTVAAAAFREGFVDRNHAIAIDMPGGRLYVEQSDEKEHVTLTGPTEYTFKGTIDL